LDNQHVLNQNSLQRFALVGLAILLAIAIAIVGTYLLSSPADPYIKSVMSLSGDRAQGQAIFQMNCAGCHGFEAEGNVGPSLQGVSKRKSGYSLIHQVISGDTPPMPKFQPSQKEMADLLSYLETL
jgi:mono/diheme cytochrome c family protein